MSRLSTLMDVLRSLTGASPRLTCSSRVVVASVVATDGATYACPSASLRDALEGLLAQVARARMS